MHNNTEIPLITTNPLKLIRVHLHPNISNQAHAVWLSKELILCFMCIIILHNTEISIQTKL